MLRLVYSHSIRRTYRASLCTSASVFQLVTLVLVIVCPLLVAYRSQGFWVKISSYRELPDVRFKYQYLLYLHGDRPDRYWLWTGFPGLLQLEQARLRVPTLRVYEPDDDRDGKSDRLRLNAVFPMTAGERVHGLTFVLIFDYRLELYSRFQMETMVHAQHQNLIEGSAISVVGDLRLVQKTPLRHRGVDDRFAKALINGSSLDADSFRMINILKEYQSRNLSTKLEPVVMDWMPGQAGQFGQFSVDITVNYVSDSYQYWTGFWELIKWGWIQYLSILQIFVFVIDRIREFVFRNRLLPTVATTDKQLCS